MVDNKQSLFIDFLLRKHKDHRREEVMIILGFIATILSVVGYLIVSNIKASTNLKMIGLYIRLLAALLFIFYTISNKDYSFLVLTLFYTTIDLYNLKQMYGQN